ncbi:MAG: glucose-6-phosphate 1-epimerase, partial [Verrucomicrobiota bacterium]
MTFQDGRGDLPMLEIKTPWSVAEIYLHGAHVTHFKKNDEPPLLFLSQCSRFADDQPIRGGVPIIFPWFGPREGMAAHGFARLKTWALKEMSVFPDGTVCVRFQLPDCPETKEHPPCTVEFAVTVNHALQMELIVTNQSAGDTFEFENCLHTYFAIGNINSVSISGLNGTGYLDKVGGVTSKIETEDAIRISSEVDRVYLDTTGAVEIRDEQLKRVVRVEKENSASTVVWNPWIAKSQQMADFGNEEYREMVCVESGNVAS